MESEVFFFPGWPPYLCLTPAWSGGSVEWKGFLSSLCGTGHYWKNLEQGWDYTEINAVTQHSKKRKGTEAVTFTCVWVRAWVSDWPSRALEGSEFVPCEARLLRDDKVSEKSLVRFCWLRSRLRRPWCCGLQKQKNKKKPYETLIWTCKIFHSSDVIKMMGRAKPQH